MTAESVAQDEKTPKIMSLPEEAADEFVEGTFEHTSMASLSGRGVLYAERPERMSGVEGNTLLRVRYAHSGIEGRMYFDYLTKDTATGAEKEYASMVLRRNSDNEYVLEHRYVIPELRNRKGIGSQLYLQAEDWVQQIATRIKKPITLLAGVSQYDVLTWLTKQGYTPQEECVALYQDIMDNVGVTNKYQLQGDEDEGWYAPYTILENSSGEEREGDSIRLVLKKVIQPGN